MSKKSLFTYTTKIDPVKTINEIQEELTRHGAKSIRIDYEEGQPSSLSFLIDTPHGEVGIKLPCNHKPILEVLRRQRVKNKRVIVNKAQAYRVSWRILLYWVKAQMAIFEAEMVTIDQIFLPYIISDDGRVLYDKFLENRFQIEGEVLNE